MDFESSPITAEAQRYVRERLCQYFPSLIECTHDNYLSLWKYISSIPERFYDERSAAFTIDFLSNLHRNDPIHLAWLFTNIEWFPDIAFKSLNEINQLDWHDAILPRDEYRLMQFAENVMHPAYLRLLESVYSPLILPFAAQRRVTRDKKLDGLDLFNRVQELEATNASFLSSVYNNGMRNAIAHGTVLYGHFEVSYQDRNHTFVQQISETVKCIDYLVDVCNGLALGYRLFFLTNLEFLEEHGVHIPLPVTFEELQAEVDAPRWTVKGYVESEISVGDNQLVVFCEDSLFDPLKFNYYMVRSAVLSEKYAPGYKHYFLRSDSKHSLISFAGFDGDRLGLLRAAEAPDLDANGPVLDHRGISFAPRPRLPKFILRLATFFSVFKGLWHTTFVRLDELRHPFAITVRDVEMHRNGLHSVINGSVVIKARAELQEVEDIRVHKREILSRATKAARKQIKLRRGLRYLPNGYIRIIVFDADKRIRLLRNSGLIPELVCTIQKSKLTRISSPDIFGGIPEQTGVIRMVWNVHAIRDHNWIL
jgi:hypothetical protein